MQDPTFRPPIPTPDGNTPPIAPLINVSRGDWQTAPLVVKSWAYILTWLGLIFTPIAMVIVFSTSRSQESTSTKLGMFTFYVLLFAFLWWLNRAIKSGKPVAWTVQIILSILGLLAFPLGTLIHGYILSQWFKPETKAWFGHS